MTLRNRNSKINEEVAEGRGAFGAANDSAILKRAYFWNTCGSLLNAFQSVIILSVLTRVCDITAAGVFTLAYANGNLFHFVGLFGMRSFEASDVAPRYGFKAYFESRIISTIGMVICSWSYLAYSAVRVGYSTDKVCVIALMTLYKCIDVIEDVFDGNYQQQGRLDIAGKQMTLRASVGMIVFCGVSALTSDLALATAAATIFAGLFLALNLLKVHLTYSLPAWHHDAIEQNPIPLMAECSAPFIASFLLFYISNAPKWSIDSVMDDVAQAQYGFIAMPVFVVNLLSEFIYMPIVRPLSGMWDEGDGVGFRKAFLRQSVIIAAVTAICIAAAFVVGVPVLSLLYNTDLRAFRVHMCMLLLGGGLYALTRLFYIGIVVMRRQDKLVLGYSIVALIAWFASAQLVKLYGISGAVACYITSMAVLAAWFGIVFWTDAGKCG